MTARFLTPYIATGRAHWAKAGMRFIVWFLAMSSLALSACDSLRHSAWTRSPVDVPDRWHSDDEGASAGGASAPPASAVDANPLHTIPDANATDIAPWWEAFGDIHLDQLIERALAGNQDLKTAIVNLRAAKFDVDLARANQFPIFGANASFTNTHSLHGTHLTSHANSLTASVSYVVDLWGTLASSTEAARWEARATEEDERAVRMTVAASVADDYWLLALLTKQIELSNATIAYDERTFAISTVRYRTGAISAIDLFAVQQSIATQKAELSALLTQRSQTENALAVLLGVPPGNVIEVASSLLQTKLPVVAAGVPADVLARRPDVRAAELRTRRTLASLDATRTSFYPNISLTGSAGTVSDAVKNFLQNPIGTVAVDVAAPFLNVWTMKAQVGIAQTAYDAASIVFAKTFYQALSDVESALAARDFDQREIDQWALALEAAKQTELRIGWQYQTGAIPLQNLLDAQQATRNLEASLASARNAQLTNQVALYMALGGR